jgi:rfaE bifunctional protein kinase chain/domain
MKYDRLKQITDQFKGKRIVVCGDFFLDRYLWIDPDRAEISVETGSTAHQVITQTCAPGAAGTVVANLVALGAEVICLGVIGDDGDGYMLRRGLTDIGADDHLLVVTPNRPTPTYTKPSIRHADGHVTELERLDIRSREPLDHAIIQQIANHLDTLADTVDAIVFADQMPEVGCGVIGSAIHDAIQEIAKTHPQLPMFADSRQRIHQFTNVTIKPNIYEACNACGLDIHNTNASPAAITLAQRTLQPVVITLGAAGVLVCEQNACQHIDAIDVDQVIDVVGAGDSVMAALAISRASGATLAEAAEIAMFVAGVTVRQIGTTGTASIHQIIDIAQRYQRLDR